MMKLKELLSCLPEYELIGSPDVEISSLAYDSRHVQSGDLFAALPGARSHGIDFLVDAEKAGAKALLTDRPGKSDLSQVIVQNPRLELARLSNHFWGYPSTRLKLIGVTGTNGKTTTTFLLRAILQAAGVSCGMIGTVRYSGKYFSTRATKTTPESPELQELLQQLTAEGTKACAIEVSSQGLSQYRVAGCVFEAAVFTNLTHEHLDYHKSMEEYFQAKMMLFDNATCVAKVAVVNCDDPYGLRLIKIRRSAGLQTVSYGFNDAADFQIRNWSTSVQGSEMTILHSKKLLKLKTPLVGKYNLYNICAAVAVGKTVGVSHRFLRRGVKNMSYVPGRMEELYLGQPFTIIIDYAHTHDAFQQLLPTLRLYTKSKLIHIFGCRGERDKTKRPKMGKVSSELADIVVLTSDNPMHEDPVKIIAQIRKGIDPMVNGKIYEIPDRADAIAFAVKVAGPGDTVVITGKGNETYQLIGDRKLPFDERAIFAAALSRESSPL